MTSEHERRQRELREWLSQEFEHAKKLKSKGGLAKLWGAEASAVSRVLSGTRDIKVHEVEIAKAYFSGDTESLDVDLSDPATVSELDVRAGAGAGGIAIESFEPDGDGGHMAVDRVKAHWGIPPAFVRNELRATPGAVRIIEVLGDSMEPTLKPGDRILIDINHRTPSPPGIYAVWDGYGVVVKRVEPVRAGDDPMVRLISDNANHRPYELSLAEANIIGRAICKISAM